MPLGPGVSAFDQWSHVNCALLVRGRHALDCQRDPRSGPLARYKPVHESQVHDGRPSGFRRNGASSRIRIPKGRRLEERQLSEVIAQCRGACRAVACIADESKYVNSLIGAQRSRPRSTRSRF